jgi:hypothetical protein
MFLNRNVYEYKIGELSFKSNETRGTVEVFDNTGRMVKFKRTVPNNYSDFQSLAFNIYNDIDEDYSK